MSCPFLSLLPPSSPSLPIHMPSAWSCDSVECVIGMVAARHARHAQRVICTHLTLTPTPSLPLLAVSLFMCRHGSAAVMPCSCDCIHWRCWWLPLPSHLLPPFSTSLFLLRCFVASLPGVRWCWWRGKGMRVSHSHTTGLLPTTPGLWLLVCAGG